MANVPFLTPTPYTPPQATPAPYTPPQATPAPPASSNVVEELLDYLDKNVRKIPKSLSYRSAPELRRLLKLKKLKKEIDEIYEQKEIFQVREFKSAFRGFLKEYIIDGKLGFDPRSFMNAARENMTKVLRDNRRTKVKLVLTCYMEFERTNEIRAHAFHSEIEVNLDGTDEKEIYDRMVDRVLEKISTFIHGKGGPMLDFIVFLILNYTPGVISL